MTGISKFKQETGNRDKNQISREITKIFLTVRTHMRVF